MAKLCTRSSSITCRELSREWRVRFARVPQKRKGRQSRPKHFRNSSAAAASGASVLREFLRSAKAANRGPKHFRNSSAAAASGASVLREFLRSAKAANRGPKHFRNSSAAAASGASVLREFLRSNVRRVHLCRIALYPVVPHICHTHFQTTLPRPINALSGRDDLLRIWPHHYPIQVPSRRSRALAAVT